MNIQSWIILAIVGVCVVLAIRVYRKKGTTCSCGTSADGTTSCECCSSCCNGACKSKKS